MISWSCCHSPIMLQRSFQSVNKSFLPLLLLGNATCSSPGFLMLNSPQQLISASPTSLSYLLIHHHLQSHSGRTQ